jgi:hypothetical protein
MGRANWAMVPRPRPNSDMKSADSRTGWFFWSGISWLSTASPLVGGQMRPLGRASHGCPDQALQIKLMGVKIKLPVSMKRSPMGVHEPHEAISWVSTKPPRSHPRSHLRWVSTKPCHGCPRSHMKRSPMGVHEAPRSHLQWVSTKPEATMGVHEAIQDATDGCPGRHPMEPPQMKISVGRA